MRSLHISMESAAGRVLRTGPLLFASLYMASCMPPAQQGGAGAPTDPKAFIFSTVYFILMVLLVYFVLVIHPARLKQESQDKFVRGLKKNDEVITSGGIFARIVAVKPEVITLEIAPNIKIKVDPQHVRQAPKSAPEQDKAPVTKK